MSKKKPTGKKAKAKGKGGGTKGSGNRTGTKAKSTSKGKPAAAPSKPPRIALSKDEQHYLVDGERYDRMTHVISVLDPGFERVKDRMPDKMEEYGEYGDLVHKITELDDRNRHKAVDEMLLKYPDLAIVLAAWRVWVDDTVKEFISIETPVWSPKYHCAGTIDRVAILQGDHRPSIIDIKTSSSIRDAAFVQMAGYKLLYNEKAKGRDKVVRTVVVGLPRPDPGAVHVKEKDASRFEKKFAEAVTLYRKRMGQE